MRCSGRGWFVLAAALAFACSSPERSPSPPVAIPATKPPVAALDAAVPDTTDPVLAKRLDAVIDKAIATQLDVGVAVVIARDGKIVYARDAGLADREANVLVRETTQFRIASMTKPIVSAAALALIEQGKLSLDDPVTKWLPEFRPKLGRREPVITVRHLLTHTSGLTYKFLEPAGGPYHKAEVSDGLGEPGFSATENLQRLAAVPLGFAPGTKWSYGLSLDVLGEIVARAGGGTLPEVVARTVTRPLAMTGTMFAATDHARVAWPYAAGKPPVRMTEPHDMAIGTGIRFSPQRIFDPASFPSGGAGLVSTARDYLRFLETLRTGGGPILKPETARSMVDNQIGELAFRRGERFGFGFAVIVDPAAKQTPKGRGTFGWGGVYGTGFWVDPEARLSVVILTNVAGDNPLDDQLERALYAYLSGSP